MLNLNPDFADATLRTHHQHQHLALSRQDLGSTHEDRSWNLVLVGNVLLPLLLNLLLPGNTVLEDVLSEGFSRSRHC